MDIEKIVTIAAGIVAIVGGIYATIRWGKKWTLKIWRFFTRYRPKVPNETLRIVPQPWGGTWSKGSHRRKPAIGLHGKWYVTNIIDEPVRVLRVHTGKTFLGGFVLVRHPNHNIFGDYPILPGTTSEVSVDIWMEPKEYDENSDLETTVVFVDQFGNEHKVKNFRFRTTKSDEPKEVELPKESIHAISDPIEKEIAAVLKAEVDRYKQCGRREGGLGSVQTVFKGKEITGVGSEGRSASPKIQSIILDANGEMIQSDNATALINLYRRFKTLNDQTKFFESLLSRLKKDCEYSSVGYLIVLVLFRIGRLPHGLQVAKGNLQGDKTYGFSDVLRLIDGLLRFEHPAFTNELLDEIEKFVEGISEYTFNIHERIAAIRAYRLASRKE
jgi:hypothetical protein